MGQITLDQSHQVIATLMQNTDWGSIDFDLSDLQRSIVCNPKGAGAQFTAFLKNGGKIIVGEPKIVKINRGRFNPAKFIGQGWSIVADQTDVHSTNLAELDLTKVQHVTMLKDGESRIAGEERLKRLKGSGYIRLDADIFYALWENKYLIPESWKEKVNGNIRYIFFEGTIFRYPDGCRCVLCLYWRDGQWHRHVDWLGLAWRAYGLSAVLDK